MPDPDAVSMREPIAKLRDLRPHFRDARGGDITYRFAAYVADPESCYFDDGDEISPEEFIITWSQAMMDITAGTNSYSGTPVPAELSMLGLTMQSLATLDTEGLAHAVFPESFARAISEIMAIARGME